MGQKDFRTAKKIKPDCPPPPHFDKKKSQPHDAKRKTEPGKEARLCLWYLLPVCYVTAVPDPHRCRRLDDVRAAGAAAVRQPQPARRARPDAARPRGRPAHRRRGCS